MYAHLQEKRSSLKIYIADILNPGKVSCEVTFSVLRRIPDIISHSLGGYVQLPGGGEFGWLATPLFGVV